MEVTKMAKPKPSMSKIIDDARPKHQKYRYVITDDTVYEELAQEGYNLDLLDTIQNDELVHAALAVEDYQEYEREAVSKAKEPTILDNGVILSKQLITKADAKLKKVLVGPFEYNGLRYTVVRFKYERFDIIELFVIT